MDSSSNPIILIVEDEAASLNLLASYFENEGYETLKATNGEQAMGLIADRHPDVALLDINLPGKDGLQLLREIREQSQMGVIFVTSKKDDVDRIVGLELGADDYVTKPFNPRELLVRVKNLVSRLKQATSSHTDLSKRKLVNFEGFELNPGRRVLTSPHGDCMQLTEGEYKLLLALMNHAGQVLSRDSIMNEMDGRDWFPNDRTIDVLIARLRKKLGDSRDDPRFINTAHGAGYIFVAEIDSAAV